MEAISNVINGLFVSYLNGLKTRANIQLDVQQELNSFWGSGVATSGVPTTRAPAKAPAKAHKASPTIPSDVDRCEANKKDGTRCTKKKSNKPEHDKRFCVLHNKGVAVSSSATPAVPTTLPATPTTPAPATPLPTPLPEEQELELEQDKDNDYLDQKGNIYDITTDPPKIIGVKDPKTGKKTMM